MDCLGHFLRATPHFRGRGRLVQWWLRQHRSPDVRARILPGGAQILCEMDVPYEAMTWLRHEEQEDLEALRCMLRPGQNFVDCGANIGLWSLVAARAVSPGGKVFAFEPNPRTHARLEEHVKRNGLSENVSTINACAGAEEGFVSFRCEAEHNVSRVTPGDEPGTIRVPTVTLDAALAGKRVDGIKIDVEGHELHVLRGAEGILRRDRPWICVEFNTTLTPAIRLREWDVHQLLLAAKYRVRLFVDAPDADALNGDWQCHGYCNLLYLPE